MNDKKDSIQKVEVTNHPKKDIWDKIQIFVTIFALLIALISTSLYINEINRSPELYIEVSSPEHILGKVSFVFTDTNMSKPSDFYIMFHNKGDKKSEYAYFMIMFGPLVEVALYKNNNWQKGNLFSNKYKSFVYTSDKFSLPSKNRKAIGKFLLSIPKGMNKILMASFVLSGDFHNKYGLIYYDYTEKKYIVDHFEDPLDIEQAVEIWNQHVIQWNVIK